MERVAGSSEVFFSGIEAGNPERHESHTVDGRNQKVQLGYLKPCK